MEASGFSKLVTAKFLELQDVLTTEHDQEVDGLREKLASVQAELSDLQSRPGLEESLRSEIKGLEEARLAEKEQASTEVLDLKLQIQDLQEAKDQSSGEVEAFKAEIEELKRAQKSQTEQASNEVEELKSKIQDLQEAKERSTGEAEAFKAELEELKRAQTSRTEGDHEVATLKADLEKLRKERDALSESAQGQAAEIQELKEAQLLEMQLSAQEVEDLKGRIKELEAAASGAANAAQADEEPVAELPGGAAEQAAREAAEKAAREAAEQEARDKAEQAAREAAEKEAAEQAAREAAEKAAREAAEQEARDKAEQAARETAEQVARDEAEAMRAEIEALKRAKQQAFEETEALKVNAMRAEIEAAPTPGAPRRRGGAFSAARGGAFSAQAKAEAPEPEKEDRAPAQPDAVAEKASDSARERDVPRAEPEVPEAPKAEKPLDNPAEAPQKDSSDHGANSAPEQLSKAAPLAPNAAFHEGQLCEVIGTIMRRDESLESPKVCRLEPGTRVEVKEIGTGPTGKRIKVVAQSGVVVKGMVGWISVVSGEGVPLLTPVEEDGIGGSSGDLVESTAAGEEDPPSKKSEGDGGDAAPLASSGAPVEEAPVESIDDILGRLDLQESEPKEEEPPAPKKPARRSAFAGYAR